MAEQNVLRRHPELAQLWTLHYAGRVALKSLEHLRTLGPPLLVRPVVEELFEAIHRLLEAVEDYKKFVEFRQNDVVVAVFPEHWSDEQLQTVMAMLGEMSDRFHLAREASGGSGRTLPR